MHSMDKTPYGFSITLEGDISVQEWKTWEKEIEEALLTAPIEIKLIIDVTNLAILRRESKSGYEGFLKIFLEHGLLRSCVLYTSSNLYLQIRNISSRLKFSGERYINITKVPSHKRLSREWLVFEKEPHGNS